MSRVSPVPEAFWKSCRSQSESVGALHEARGNAQHARHTAIAKLTSRLTNPPSRKRSPSRKAPQWEPLGMIAGISPPACVLFAGRNGRSVNSPGSKMGRAFGLSSAARRVSPCRLVCLGRCALARQELIELAVELGQVLHGKSRDKLAARHDHLHLAQFLQVLERVLVEHNEIGRFPRLD